MVHSQPQTTESIMRISKQRCAVPPVVAVAFYALYIVYKLLSFCRLPAGKADIVETVLYLKPQWSYYSNPQGFTLTPH